MSHKKLFLEFGVWLSVVFLFLLIVYQMIYIFWPHTPSPDYITYIFLVPYILNLVVYFMLLKSMDLEPQYFVQIIILSIVVKIIIYGAFNFIMIYNSPDHSMANVISFFVIYLFSTGLEIGMLIPLIGRSKKQDKNRR